MKWNEITFKGVFFKEFQYLFFSIGARSQFYLIRYVWIQSVEKRKNK